MSNSNLATSHYWTSNFSSRGGKKIDKIIIHHIAGNLNAKQCYNVWKTREASAHYVIDSSGNIGQCIDEKYRAWSVASSYWDSRGVAIECANNSGSPNWTVSDATIKSCIKLVADIAYRNGIQRITYTGDTSGTLIMHRWIVSTACPGPYLMKKFLYIAKEADKILQEKRGKKTEVKSVSKTILSVDGVFGKASITRAQEVFGTPKDGRISGQLNAVKPYIKGIDFNQIDFCDGSSSLIKAIQKKVGWSPVDGRLTKPCIRKIQKWLKVDSDGYWGPNTSKAFQKWLNKQ